MKILKKLFDRDFNELLGHAKNYSKQIGLPWDKIKDEMTSGDYENLVQVFDKYFGAFVTLYR